VSFVLLYIREPHPGQGKWKEIEQPARYDERLELAQRTCDELSATTLTLVDEMDNAVKRAYGDLPNSAYLIGSDGLVFHKQPWMNARVLRPPLEALLAQGGAAGPNPVRFDTGVARARPRPEDKPADVARFKDAPIEIPAAAVNEIVWGGDLEEALATAKQAGVPVLVEFFFDGCAYCAAMAEGPLRDPRVVALSRKYVCVQLDRTAPEGERLADEWELVGTPAFAVLDPSGKVVHKHVNYAEADFLTQFLTDGLESRPR
jgi:thiol-disulfide isomerase/thioredoxin